MTPAKRTGRDDGSDEERKDEEDREEENHDDGHASNDDDASEKQQDNNRSCSESPSNLTASNDDDARAQEEEGRATASSSLAATASQATDDDALTSSAGDRATLSLRGVGGRTIMTLPAPDAVKSSALALLLVERSGVPGAYCERNDDTVPPPQVRGSRRAVEGGGAVAFASENDSGHDDAADRSSSSSSRAAAAQQGEEENESEESSSRTSQSQEQDAVGIDQSSAEETALVLPCSSSTANDDRAARMDERADENEPAAATDVGTTAPHGPDEEEEEGLVSAILVHDNDVVEAAPLENTNEMHVKRAAVYGGVALATLATIVGLAVGLATRIGAGDGGGDDESAWSPGPPTVAPSPTYDFRPTLERVADEGVLKCGIPDALGFGRRNETTGEVEGFSVDLCRAVAAAVLGENYAVKTTFVTNTERWEALDNRSIDLLIRADTHTMERDLHEPSVGVGFTFTVPYFYDGLRFGGVPHYVDCADMLDRSGNCSGIQICVDVGTTHYDILTTRIPGHFIASVDSASDFPRLLEEGMCNIVAGELLGIARKSMREGGYRGPYKVGKEVFSKEPLAMVTREDSPEFSEFANLVLQSLISAEKDNVTQYDPAPYSNFSFFGGDYEYMLVDALSAVGNFREMYDRHFQDIVPRTTMNEINHGGSGLIYSHPFGGQSDGPAQALNGTIDRIMQRGRLRCGISARTGFGNFDVGSGQWSGLDADFCRALAAGLFAGDDSAVEFVNVSLDKGRFNGLGAGEVDVLSGCSVRFQGGDEVQNDSYDTGEGFLYSQPYYYFPDSGNNSSTASYHALATRQDDAQWFGFVYWVVSSIFFAEESEIKKGTYYQMPLVNLFGPDFTWLFRDVISRVGNYGEMYERNVESLFPRDGSRNQLNRSPIGPQHFPLKGLS